MIEQMKNAGRFLALVLALLAVAFVGHALATDSDAQLYSRSKLEVSTGTAVITTTSADYTSYQTLVTITNPSGAALEDVRFVVDLAKATTGFAATYTSGTVQISVARKVDGTNYRTAVNLANAAVSGTNSTALSVDIWAGDVGPNETIKLMVKVSAESNSNTDLPYVVTYRGSSRATVTPTTS